MGGANGPPYSSGHPYAFPRGVPGIITGSPPSAEWADPADIVGNPYWHYAQNRLFLGDCESHEIGVDDNRHIMTIAGSRAGKSSTALIPNLLRYPGSAFVIDPKGELAAMTARARYNQGQAVYVLDPFGITPFRSHSFNPFHEIARAPKHEVPDNAAVLAESLIVNERGGTDHWTLSARNLVKGLILDLLSG